jgi:hypothetical protein
MRQIFFSNYYRIQTRRTWNGLTLNIIKSRYIHTISGFQSLIEEHDLQSQRILISVPIEKVERRLTFRKIWNDINIQILSKNAGSKFELFFTFDNTNELFLGYFDWPSLKICPVSK